jgi:hypothetical protein
MIILGTGLVMPMFRKTPIEFMKSQIKYREDNVIFRQFDDNVYIFTKDSSGKHDFLELMMLEKTWSRWKIIYSGGHAESDMFSKLIEPGEIIVDYEFSVRIAEAKDSNRKTYFGHIKDDSIHEIKFIVDNITTKATIFFIEDKRYYYLNFEADEPLSFVIARAERELVSEETFIRFDDQSYQKTYYHYDLSHASYYLDEELNFIVIGNMPITATDKLRVQPLKIEELTLEISALYDGIFISDQYATGFEINHQDIIGTGQDIFTVHKTDISRTFIEHRVGNSSISSYSWMPGHSEEMNYYRAMYHIVEHVYKDREEVSRYQVTKIRVENKTTSFILTEEELEYYLDAVDYVDYLDGQFRPGDKVWDLFYENDLKTLKQFGVYYTDERVMLHDVSNDKYGYIKVFDLTIREMFDSYN